MSIIRVEFLADQNMAICSAWNPKVVGCVFILRFILTAFFDLPQIVKVHLAVRNFRAFRPWRLWRAFWSLLNSAIIEIFSRILSLNFPGYVLNLLNRDRKPLNREIDHIHYLFGVNAVRISSLWPTALTCSWALIRSGSSNGAVWAQSILAWLDKRSLSFEANAVL